MTSPNHIACGLFFTGFWASFWNINIFQKPLYIAVAIISSLLPDIDHNRSAIGFIFYPLSTWLNKKYGHRTITHSLLFFMFSTVALFFTERLLEFPALSGITIIYFFGILSHLLVDMTTVTGVPLLYPFRRNPCVIPGRSEFRLNTGNVKSELAAFFIFCSLNFLCFDLYRNGFWFTYNNTFSTIEHVHFERANSPNFTLCKYYFIQEGKEYRGVAPIIASKESTLELFIKGKVVRLDYSTPGLVVKAVNPIKTNFPFKYIHRSFYKATDTSINNFCRNQIVTGSIQSNEGFILNFYKPDGNGIEENKRGEAQELLNYTGVYIIPKSDALENAAKYIRDSAAIAKQIAIKMQTLIQDSLNFNKTHEEYFILKRQEKVLKANLAAAADISTRNTLENELIRIMGRLQFIPVPYYTPNTVTLETIHQLGLQLTQTETATQLFNAELSCLDLPDSLLGISK